MQSLPLPELVTHASSGIVYLTDDALFNACGVRVAFTERHGGTSEPPFDELNLGSHVGDDLASVEANRALAMTALGAPRACGEPLVLNQVHGTRVLAVSRQTSLEDVRAEAHRGADGVVVAPDAGQVAPLLCFADCMPLIFVGPEGAFGVAHAGWRGVMGEIAKEALDRLRAVSGVRPDEVNVYVGPHIRACCFEVSDELASDFRQRFGVLASPKHRHVDLVASVRSTLEACGVSPDRICDARVCTSCNVQDFYSYRAEGGQCGRHGAVAFRGKD